MKKLKPREIKPRVTHSGLGNVKKTIGTGF